LDSSLRGDGTSTRELKSRKNNSDPRGKLARKGGGKDVLGGLLLGPSSRAKIKNKTVGSGFTGPPTYQGSNSKVEKQATEGVVPQLIWGNHNPRVKKASFLMGKNPSRKDWDEGLGEKKKATIGGRARR